MKKLIAGLFVFLVASASQATDPTGNLIKYLDNVGDIGDSGILATSVAKAPLTGSVTVTGGSSLVAACYTTSSTVTGAVVGKVAKASWTADPGGLINVSGVWVSASNTVSVKICNPSTGTTPNVTLNVEVSQ